MLKNNEYKEFNAQTPSKKMLVFFLDVFFVFVLTFVSTLFVSTPILRNNAKFVSTNNELREVVLKLYDYQEDAKLSIRKSEEELLSDSELFDRYVSSQISYSYDVHISEYNSYNITLTDTSNKASYDNDLLGYYYVSYKFNNNIAIDVYNEISPKQYFINLIKNSDVSAFFEYDNETLPVLSSLIGQELYKFKSGEMKKSENYQKLSNFFIKTNHNALLDLQNFSEYSSLRDNYFKCYEYLANAQNGVLLLTYSICYVLLMVIPFVVFGNGITLGRLITKTRLTYNKTPISILINIALGYVQYFIVVAFIALLTTGIQAFNISIGGWLNLFIFTGVSLVFTLLSFIFLTFSKDKRSLFEKLSMSTNVDIKKQNY